ncbi:MAG: hypothetical protein PHD91_06805 [bacterium]|jgi:hypothetical protein|nr:hypothetical protein [bacterium]MDD3805658.1 hypothetical protein [bacterium]MDD4153408.1 hypothetical protein [bacterium]MDD4557453.1 hypothetical protein [bacterium]
MADATEQDKLFFAELEKMPRHFSALSYPEGKIAIDDEWRITTAGREKRVCRGAEALRKFLNKYCRLSLSVAESTVSGEKKRIYLSWKEEAGEGFSITVKLDSVEIMGDSPAGALYGAHRLQWMMGANGGPYLEPGEYRVQPSASVRISATPFRQGFDDAGDPLTYGDGYLDLMAHYGYNGLHFYINLFDYMERVPAAPELENREAAGRIDRLRLLAERAARYNVGIYLHINASKLSCNHPVFSRHSQLKGAQSWEEGFNVLCSGAPQTWSIYADTVNAIMDSVPTVQGVIAIIGGECLWHCYTRPYPRPEEGTNCPVCAGQSADKVVADFVNGIANRIWEVHPDSKFIVWPYSAHLWSESREQKEFIPLLNKRIGLMTCYDKDAWLEVDGIRSAIFDYSVSYVGPSPKYEVQRDICSREERDFYIKTESSIGIEMLNLPYVPAMVNWRRRWRGMMADCPRGVLANWRFTGLTGTLSEEVSYRETWRDTKGEESLQTMAERLAGVEGASECLKAWELLSRSFSRISFSFGISGFPYFRGPMYLGPAHPLLLSGDQGRYLSPKFYNFDAWAYTEDPLAQDDESKANLTQNPLYFDDQRWASPFGIKRVLADLEDVCTLWAEGMKHYLRALESAPEPLKADLQREIDVALMAEVTLKSALFLARFQTERDRTFGPLKDEEADQSYRRMVRVVKDDLENSRLGLDLARRYFRYGYGFVYGRSFDVSTIEEKIKFTREKLLPEIDWYYELLITHAYSRPFIKE